MKTDLMDYTFLLPGIFLIFLQGYCSKTALKEIVS